MKKLAFLIGVNKYTGSAKDAPQLRSCVNDVQLMQENLILQFGFAPEDIRILVDERATKAEILSRWHRYVSELEPGDLFVTMMSSYGTRYPLRSSMTGALSSPVDILVASDFTWDNPVLIGPEIGHLFASVSPGAQVVFILDTAHSTLGATRAMVKPEKFVQDMRDAAFSGPVGASSKVTVQPLSKFLPPPADISHRSLSASLGQKDFRQGFHPSGMTLFTAAGKNGNAADALLGSKYYGVFSWAFCKALRDLKNPTYAELLNRTQETIHNLEFTQVPECLFNSSGRDLGNAGGTPAFGGKDVPRSVASTPDEIQDGNFFTGYGRNNENEE